MSGESPTVCAAAAFPYARPFGLHPVSKNVYEPPAFPRPSFAIFSSPHGRPGNASSPALQHVSHTPNRTTRAYVWGRFFNERFPDLHSLPRRAIVPIYRIRSRAMSTDRVETKANVRETLKLPSIFRSESNGEIDFYVRFWRVPCDPGTRSRDFAER